MGEKRRPRYSGNRDLEDGEDALLDIAEEVGVVVVVVLDGEVHGQVLGLGTVLPCLRCRIRSDPGLSLKR